LAGLRRLRRGDPLDARGVAVSANLLQDILAAAPPDAQGRPFLQAARFDHATLPAGAFFQGTHFGEQISFCAATFGDSANFTGGAVFGAWADFSGATFGSAAAFHGATFGDHANFNKATFGDRAGFRQATFGARATFAHAKFGDDPRLDEASFGDRTSFDSAGLGANARFRDTTFGDDVSFENTRFGDLASFARATFGRNAWFPRASFGIRAWLDCMTAEDGISFFGATFGDWVHFGPLLVTGSIELSQAIFARAPEIRVSADRLYCRSMQLPDGGTFFVRWAEMVLDGTDFGRPSVLNGTGRPFDQLDEAPLATMISSAQLTSSAGIPRRSALPRVVSLQGSDVEHLVLTHVDLRACRFFGAHNLDQLSLQGRVQLAAPPKRLHLGRALPPAWWWTSRQAIAEEHRWRWARPKCRGWYPRECRTTTGERPQALEARDLAKLYRALRKGREDRSDEPGAADFYYGEMEMRRHDRTTPWPERLILWFYWLLSGYALRTTRALIAVLVVLLTAAWLFSGGGGFDRRPYTAPTSTTTVARPTPTVVVIAPPTTKPADTSFLGAVRYASRTAVGLPREPQPRLSAWGDALQILVRIVVPVLLGLALLSIRGRVKR
jgi:hypothetical protein